MGEAKRRAKEITEIKARLENWRIGLTPSELLILQTAERIDERLVRGRRFTEGCYHLAFFMTRHLAIRGIDVVPVIGWVSDGLWEGVTSHAWIEYNGKITDASLTLTSHPQEQPSGALLVQDFKVRTGRAEYAYYKDDAQEVVAGRKYIGSVPELAAVWAHKEAQHATMQAIATEGRFDEYLSAAPVGGRYEDIAALIN